MLLRAEILKFTDALLGRALAILLGNSRAVEASGEGREIPAPSRVLVIRPGGIGDAVLFVPMLRFLRDTWPGAVIEVLMEQRNSTVIAHTGLVDSIHCYDRLTDGVVKVLRTRYDLVIDTEQYHHLSAMLAFLTRAPRRIGFGTTRRRRFLTELVPYSQEVYEARSFLDLAAAATGRKAPWDPDRPFYTVPSHTAEFAQKVLQPLEGLPLVAIHPGASIPERRWPPERYARLAGMLAERGMAILVLGGPTDVKAAAVIANSLGDRPHVNLAGRCNLAQAAALVEQAWVYVSADSGVLHLAYGVGTPTVHLFGPGVLAKWGPPGRRFRTVEKTLRCSPCTRYGYTPPCNQGQQCMLRITPEEVFEATWDQIESTGQIPSAGEARP